MRLLGSTTIPTIPLRVLMRNQNLMLNLKLRRMSMKMLFRLLWMKKQASTSVTP